MESPTPDSKVSIRLTQRQCRILYDILCEKIESIDKSQQTLSGGDIDKHVSLETTAWDLEAIRESVYFEGGVGEADEENN
jgi:hypothetical protein